jgi:cytochrome P450
MVNPNLEDSELVALGEGQATFYDFCDNFIDEERRNPRPGNLIGALLDAGAEDDDTQPLTQREIISIMSQLLLGGNSTTRRLLSTLVLRLLQHPEQLTAVKADPGLADAAVEEALRHTTPVKGLYRTAVSDLAFDDVVIPEGARVVVFWASANRDDTKFDDPDRFDIFRDDANKHLAFSKFAHFCIGAPLARLEATTALRALLDRLPNLRLAEAPAYEWEPLALHQGLSRLSLVWDRAAGSEENEAPAGSVTGHRESVDEWNLRKEGS